MLIYLLLASTYMLSLKKNIITDNIKYMRVVYNIIFGKFFIRILHLYLGAINSEERTNTGIQKININIVPVS